MQSTPPRRPASSRTVAAAAAALLLTGAYVLGAPAQDTDGPTPVRGAVHVLKDGRGGNVGFQVGADGVLVVDSKFADTTASIEAALEALSKGAPEFLVNTHFHGDHTGGNAHFGSRVTILAHENVRARLAGGDQDPAGLPVVTYADGASVHFNGEQVRLLHVPNAHTDGDTIVWFTGSNVVHMGDCYFQIGFPFIDVDSGGNVLGLLAAVDLVLAECPDDVRIVSGHGEVTGKDGLREYRAMIATVHERVVELAEAGFSVDEMLEAGVTEEYEERWTWGFIDSRRFVESLVRGLGD